MTKPGLSRAALRPWKIGDISVWLNGYNNETPTDSVRYKDMTVYYEGKLRVRPSVLYNRLRFRSGDLYSRKNSNGPRPAIHAWVFSGIPKCNIPRATPPAARTRST